MDSTPHDPSDLDLPTPTVEGPGSDLPADRWGSGSSEGAELLDPLRRGSIVGRYVVLELLGSGGLGVVYSAYDPILDRKIAVKLLRPSSREKGSQRRLRREAQALAKLNHPNVVTVFDVGEMDDRVFLAMELVEGEHLGLWLKRHAEGRRGEVVGLFLQAGRGLAHAHEAGVVHRDFKPSNVRVSGSRAVVLDFGLARSVEPGEVSVDQRDGSRVIDVDRLSTGSAKLSASEDLTRAGSRIGTPSFMSPEQWRGEAATAASDQFSFCVSLFLALHGRLPFPSASQEHPQPHFVLSPGEKELPSRLQRLLERGLSSDPDARFPSMNELLAELEATAGRRRRALVAVAAGGAVLAMAAIWLGQGMAPAICEAGPERLAEVWGRPQRQAIASAFASTSKAYAPDTTRAASDALDAYGAAWTEMYRDACTATHVLGEQSPGLLDRRMICLDQRRREMGALIELFGERPAAVIEKAVRAVGDLPPIAACADAAALSAAVSPPAEPETRRRVAAIKDRLAAATALSKAGQLEAALEAAETLAADAAELRYLPLTARAAVEVARIHEKQEKEGAAEALRRAAALAQAAGEDRLAVEAMLSLIRASSYLQSDLDEGQLVADMASTVLERLTFAADLKAALADQRGLLAFLAGRYEEAEQAHRQALALERERPDTSPERVATTLIRLANVLKEKGSLAVARDSLREALQIQQRSLGERHPDIATSLERLGALDFELGELTTAESYYLRALDLFEDLHGPDHPKAAATALHLGGVYAKRGDLELALEQYEQARARLASSLGEDHPHVAVAWSNIGATQVELSRPASAVEAFARALAIQRATRGEGHPRTATTRLNLGFALGELGRHAEAIDHFEAAHSVFTSAYPEGHALTAHALHALGLAYRDLDRRRRAVDSLDRASELWQIVEADPRYGAETAWELARLLADEDGQRAEELALRALRGLRRGGLEERAEEVARWLEARGTTSGTEPAR
ncbi:MAG: serine/threonine-protein kinase [Holophagales bacterium]|nr:serine/threonine-protein kinase [Holophagales bacterium]